ncbi:hypothetical protein N7513_006033 [Penicillium frequentans]|nr:hypothetical protein N7513_006033 [Penicillium glabrum]
MYQIFGVAVAYAQLVTAAPMESKNPLNKRASTYTQYCTPNDLLALQYAVNEAKEMLSIAATRTTDLGNWLQNLNNGANLNIANEPALLQSTARTFEAIFGTLWYGAGSTKNSDALQRVLFIHNFITSFTNGLNTFWNNANFELYCTDDWLSYTAPDLSQSTTQFVYWDHRTTSTNQAARDFRASGGICRDVPTYYGWVDPEVENSPPVQGQSPQYTSVLTLCQSHVPGWTQKYLTGTTLKSLSNVKYAQGAISLDAFQGSTFTSALLHELSHALTIVGSQYLADKACTVPGKGGSAYGWECISHLATSSPADAIHNADSWTYYVTALAFQLNDWSTGVSDPMP